MYSMCGVSANRLAGIDASLLSVMALKRCLLERLVGKYGAILSHVYIQSSEIMSSAQ